jgi:hypothetical protein
VIPNAPATTAGVSVVVWAMLLLSILLVIVAAIPNQVTYRISMPVGRTVGAARLPLVASAFALTIGVAVSLLMSRA